MTLFFLPIYSRYGILSFLASIVYILFFGVFFLHIFLMVSVCTKVENKFEKEVEKKQRPIAINIENEIQRITWNKLDSFKNFINNMI